MNNKLVKENFEDINNNPNVYAPLFDGLKLYAKSNKFFDDSFSAMQEIRFNNGLRINTTYKLINVLIHYNVLQEVVTSNGKRKILISDELKCIDNIKEFLFIVNNNVSLQSYSRIKKIKKINEAKH
jgi:hypothetical protein